MSRVGKAAEQDAKDEMSLLTPPHLEFLLKSSFVHSQDITPQQFLADDTILRENLQGIKHPEAAHTHPSVLVPPA